MSDRETIKRFKADGDEAYRRIYMDQHAYTKRSTNLRSSGKTLRTAIVTVVVIAVVFGGLLLPGNIGKNAQGDLIPADSPAQAGNTDAGSSMDDVVSKLYFSIVVYASELTDEITSDVSTDVSSEESNLPEGESGTGAALPESEAGENGSPAEVEIASTTDVLLPSGKLQVGIAYDYGDSKVYDAIWQVSEFACKGDDIKTVTYTAQNGSFANYNNFTIHSVGICYNYIRRYTVAKELSERICYFTQGQESFVPLIEFLNTGELDDIIGTGLRKEIVEKELANYMISSGIVDQAGYYDWQRGIEDTPWIPSHYELQIYLAEAEAEVVYGNESFDSSSVWENGSSVTVSPEKTVNYCPPFSVLKMICDSGFTDFSSLGSDIITVTAEFNNGEELSKDVIVSFDKNGNLCARLGSAE